MHTQFILGREYLDTHMTGKLTIAMKCADMFSYHLVLGKFLETETQRLESGGLGIS